jgi:hypothetical protein
MPWRRNDPDPLETRRRYLAEQERLLSEQRRRLTEQLHPSAGSPAAQAKPAEPPLWRMEEDGPPRQVAVPGAARRRNLARQRRRDMIFFFFCMALFMIVLAVALWVIYVHNTGPVNGT